MLVGFKASEYSNNAPKTSQVAAAVEANQKHNKGMNKTTEFGNEQEEEGDLEDPEKVNAGEEAEDRVKQPVESTAQDFNCRYDGGRPGKMPVVFGAATESMF